MCLNQMCRDCRCLDTDCRGSHDKVWTGCVYKRPKFELFGGHLGNGTTVCNKAVMENGDYKHIAHISEGGRIKWYIQNPNSYVPAEDMKLIEGWATAARKKFMEQWNQLPDIVKYNRILDRFSYGWILGHPVWASVKACTELHEKVKLLETVYFEFN